MQQASQEIHDATYPTLKDGLYLHLMPEDSMLYLDDKQFVGVTINRTADEILELCDGQHSVTEISTLMAKRYDEEPERAYKLVLGFLSQAAKRGHVELSSSPSEAHGTVCGNREYWVPRMISLELTKRCPLRCRHCYAEAGPPGDDELTTQEWLTLMHEFADMGTVACLLSGGEPIIHPGFPYLLEAAANRFATISIMTSGFPVDKRIAKLIAYNARSANIAVQISLDGPREDHNELRGHPEAFDRAVTACERLAQEGIFVTIAMSVTPKTQHKIEDVIRIARDHGARAFRLGRVYPIGRARGTDLEIGIDAWRQVVSSYSRLADKYNSDTFFVRDFNDVTEFGVDPNQRINCGAGYAQIAILANGDVVPCISFLHVIGNVRQQPYDQLLGSEAQWYFKRLPAPSPSICGNCELFRFCDGCMMRGELYSRDVENCTWRPLTRGRFQ